MGQSKKQRVEELIPNSWTTKKCKKKGCNKTYKVNPYTKPDNDLEYCDDCYEEVFPKNNSKK